MPVKFRNGWDGAGAQTANWMAGPEEPAISHRLRDGVLTERNGDFINVYKGGAPLDGYYSLGKPDDTFAQYKVVASPTARGTFAMRGDAGPGAWTNLPELAYYGKGWGIVPQSSFTTVETNFDGKGAPGFTVNMNRTRDGRKFVNHIQYDTFTSPTKAFALTTFHGGVYFNDGGVRKFSAGYSGMTVLDGGQQVPYYYWEIDGEFGVGETPYIPNQLGVDPFVLACGPGNKLMMMRYHRPNYSGSIISVGANPGYFFAYTTNAGKNWTVTTSGDIFDEFSSVISLVPTEPSYGDTFNRAVENMSLQSAPLSASRSAAIAYAPYCVLGGTDGTTPIIKTKVKTGFIDHNAGFGVFETGVLFDGDPNEAPSIGIYGVPGGTLMIYVPYDGGDYATPAELRFSADGVTYTTIATMPLPPYQTGRIVAFDKKSLVCPMYDGDHSLYQSKDMGLTWTKRATIFPGGPPPPTGFVILQRFGAVTFLRDNDAPARNTPATPWFSDVKYPGPLP